MSYQILLVEDDSAIRETVQDYLEAKGLSVFTVENSELALDALWKHAFDLLLLDIYGAFPTDAADRLMEYLIYNEDWYAEDWVPGYLVGYAIEFGASLLVLGIMGFILCHALGKVLESQAEAEQRRRNLTNSIAHDLKTPMAAVLGYAENLLENTRPDKQVHYLCSIHTQTRKMNDILGKILEISRAEAPEGGLTLTEFSLGELCREAAVDCFLEDGMFLISGDAAITADRELMRRCMDNFLSNARRHVTPGELVAITIHEGSCEIYNPGDPIPKEALPHIWEPYYQADPARARGGSGLGLSIVREIMSRHGFSCEAENLPHGVLFRFRFLPTKSKKKGDIIMSINKKRLTIIVAVVLLFLLLAALILWEVYIPRPGIVLG